MSRILDLKKKKIAPAPEPEPVVQTAEAINQEVTPTLARADVAYVDIPAVLPYSALQSNEILTDRGGRFPFQTIRWVGPLGYRAEGTGIPYVIAVVLAVVGVLIAIFQQDLIASTLFIFMAIMLVVHANSPHPHVPIEISPVSIKLGNRQYSHTDIKSFWIHYDLPHEIPELSLHINRWHLPYMKIPLYDVDPSQVRMVLLEFIPEVEHDDSTSHRLLKHLGI